MGSGTSAARKSDLKGWRNEHEDVLLERFRQVLPEDVKVTVLANRGIGDQALYELLKDELGFEFASSSSCGFAGS